MQIQELGETSDRKKPANEGTKEKSTNERMDEWTNERKNGKMNEWTQKRKNERKNGRTDERKNEWSDERTNERMKFKI